MQLETKHYYDDETLEFVASRFFIDGEEVDFETYQEFIVGLEEANEDEDYGENPYEYDNDCGDCNECVCNQEEFTDQQIEEIKMIEAFAYRIENVNCDCGCEMRNLLYELFSIGKNVGWNDHKCFMKELMEEALEE